MSVSRVCFSDIDGTLVHYELEGEGSRDVLRLPPSSTGLQGAISAESIRQAAQLRAAGVKLVIVSGARNSTVLQRLPFLPAADAYITENGGRIYYPGSDLPTAVPITEDLQWRLQLSPVTGTASQEHLPPLERQGLLWDWYRELHAAGWSLDAAGYSTCFRVKTKGQPGASEDLQSVIRRAPAGLTCTFNLGVADFYPAASGKAGAAKYLMQKWSAQPADCVLLCDDDNDLELAALVGKAFLPSQTSESVVEALQQHPDHFVTASSKGTAATEEMLQAVLAHYQSAAFPAETGQQASQTPVRA